ncbi:MAG: TPM domain-containing protein [Ignavibacteriaceae bacterium]|nr:TPM domain-containing protein [Ignavibacteriaceae bacterium]
MNKLIYNFVNDDELLRITNKIKEYEKLTAGEICVSIRERKTFFQKRKSVHDLAKLEFARLGIGKTRDKTGILIYIILEERQFFILADSAINNKVNENTWHKIKDGMQEFLRKGMFSKGILHGVEETGKVLAEHFPVKPDDTNEIPDRVILS